MGKRIEIDATELTYCAFFIPGVNADQFLDGRTVQILHLEPNSYSIYLGSGLRIVTFELSAAGAIDYAKEFDGAVLGRGTSKLIIRAFQVTIDARGLNSHGFIFTHVGNVGEEKQFTSNAIVNLAATNYTILQQSGLAANFAFNVEPDGNFDYAPDLDKLRGGFLSGRGTSTLALLGYEVRINATALSYPRYSIPGMSDGFVEREAILSLRLLPDTYSFQSPASSYADFSFRVTQAGAIDFDDAFDGFLAGRSTNTLEIRGHQISIDTTQFARLIFFFALDGWVASTDIRLVPCSYAFMDSVSGIGDARFSVNRSGRLAYDPELDVSNGGYLSGMGTRQLGFHGYTLVLDMASMGAGVDLGGLHTPFEPLIPLRKISLLPQEAISLRIRRSAPLEATLSVSQKGEITLSTPGLLALRRVGANVVLYVNDVKMSTTDPGDNAMTTESEPLIKLDPSGTAPILSYNVPEPTSYAGRNFIDLQFDRGWFRQDVRLLPKTTSGSAGGGATRASESHSAAVGAESQPAVYRSMFGTTVREKTPRVSRAMKRDDQRRDEPDFPSGPPDPLLILVDIEAPIAGQTVTGSSSGVTLTVRINAYVDSGPGYITGVTIKVAGGTAQTATPESGKWTFTTTITTAGQLTLRATATHSSGRTAYDEAKVSVQLTSTPATSTTDTTPPQLSVVFPQSGQIIASTGTSANVTITGTASDPSGIASVEIYLDSTTTPYVAESANAWATWVATLNSLPVGAHSITVRCTDKSSNVTTQVLQFTIKGSDEPTLQAVRLLLVESLKLSSYTGNYGAGRTIKTFSLLPGEKTKISIKTYTRTTADAKQASSILDSFTQESADDFEKSVEQEQAYKDNYDESFKWSVHGEASASWGWGSAKIEGDMSGGTNAAREEMAKNISKATQKHTAKASAKRDIQINTSYEVKTETGEETAIERVIENVNVSRTLNFVFRQMNQEFLTVLHLLDVRVGYLAIFGDAPDQQTYKEVSLPQLDALLKEVIVPEPRIVQKVKAAIIHQLENVFDYRDVKHAFVEERPLDPLDPNSSYLRVKKDYVSTHHDTATGTEVSVPGVILAVNNHVMRTEGVIVESLLGQGQALDVYSRGLQDEAIRDRKLKNDLQSTELVKLNEAIKIVQAKDGSAASVFDTMFNKKEAGKQSGSI